MNGFLRNSFPEGKTLPNLLGKLSSGWLNQSTHRLAHRWVGNSDFNIRLDKYLVMGNHFRTFSKFNASSRFKRISPDSPSACETSLRRGLKMVAISQLARLPLHSNGNDSSIAISSHL